MRRIPILLALLLTALPAAAQLPFDTSPSGIWKRAGLRSYDVVIAVVKNADRSDATNANPPVVELTIEKVLKGDPKLDRSKARWRPASNFGHVQCGNDARLQQWMSEPFDQYPTVGDRLIISGIWSPGLEPRFNAMADGREKATDELVASAVKWYEEGARERAEMEAEIRKEQEELHARVLESWKAEESRCDLDAMLAEADFIGIADGPDNVGSTGGSFRVPEVLRGPRLSQDTGTDYFAGVSFPEGKTWVFERGEKYLLALHARTAAHRGLGPNYALLADGKGILRMTADLRARVDAWLAAHPAKPGADAEIADRARAASFINDLSRVFGSLSSRLSTRGRPDTLRSEDAVLQSLAREADSIVAWAPLESQARIKGDAVYRQGYSNLLLRRAGIAAYLAKGLEKRGGEVKEIEPDAAAELEKEAWALLDTAIKVGGLNRDRLISTSADLGPLRDSQRWKDLLETLR